MNPAFPQPGTPGQALEHFVLHGERHLTFLADGGLINRTWAVGEPPRFALQQVNAIFPPTIHGRIQRVTERLQARGLVTPTLVATHAGGVWLAGPQGTTWRLMTWIPGVTHHRIPSAEHAFRAACLVARFHEALLGLEGELVPLRQGVHDTERHLADLAQALRCASGHRLEAAVRPLGAQIQAAWSALTQRSLPTGLPERPAHGDLKISNLRFDPTGEHAICLLDLDTLGRFTLDAELGDALRSWCNPHGEDEASPELDMAVFQAAVEGYLSTARFVTPDELCALVPGLARIPLELAARFCADAVNESYFGWNPAVAPSRGEHNLIRARSQFGLAQAVQRRWADLQAIVNATRGKPRSPPAGPTGR